MLLVDGLKGIGLGLGAGGMAVHNFQGMSPGKAALLLGHTTQSPATDTLLGHNTVTYHRHTAGTQHSHLPQTHCWDTTQSPTTDTLLGHTTQSPATDTLLGHNTVTCHRHTAGTQHSHLPQTHCWDTTQSSTTDTLLGHNTVI